jgi:HTH-type transcriptional regulator/antitoxin HipB
VSQVHTMNRTIVTAMQLGQILRSARRAKKLSQAQAAARVRLSQSRLSALELDPASITTEQLLALLGLYELDLTVQSRATAALSSATEW